MTKRERERPAIINPSRKRRIAAGSGTKVEDVNRLLKQFEQMQKMMKMMGSSKFRRPPSADGCSNFGFYVRPGVKIDKFFKYLQEVTVMAVKIRLRRMGAKKAPFYRIVVADSRYPPGWQIH